MVRLYGEDPPAVDFPIFYRKISEQIDTVWPRCLELGLEVVLDLGFWSRRQRDEFRARIASIGATARLYRLACPEEEAWIRIERRNARLDGSLSIRRNTFEVLKRRFEPLDLDEDRVELASSDLWQGSEPMLQE
jgi:predicted kinase